MCWSGASTPSASPRQRSRVRGPTGSPGGRPGLHPARGEGGASAGAGKGTPATATDSQGVQRVLTGSYLRPNASVVGPPIAVSIEFTGEGSLLFEQITGGLAVGH